MAATQLNVYNVSAPTCPLRSSQAKGDFVSIVDFSCVNMYNIYI